MQFKWLSAPGDESAVRLRMQELVARQMAFQHPAETPACIYLYLTRRCNLACRHCYIREAGMAGETDCDLSIVRRLVERSLPLGLRMVKLSGGEPLLCRDLTAVLSYLDGQGLEVVLETNGTLVTPPMIDLFRGLRRFQVYISLDHLDEARHDAFRGRPGSHSQTAAAIRELGNAGIAATVTTTAYRDNYDRIAAIAGLVLGWGAARHRTLLNIHPLGRARLHPEDAITLEEAEVLIGSMLDSSWYREGRACTTLPPALTPPGLLNELTSCGWGTRVIGILSNGDISMCSASYGDADMIAGNIYRDDFIDLWRHGSFFRKLREIGQGKVSGVCSNSVFYPACRGVCRMSSYAHYGVKDAPYPLCQEAYQSGAFPRYALVEPAKNCSYRDSGIRPSRETAAGPLIPAATLAAATARTPSGS